jgi:hypothetical protein
MFFRVSFDAPPIGRVTKWFPTDDVDKCQAYVGKLQLKGIRVDVQRVSKEQMDSIRNHNEEE